MDEGPRLGRQERLWRAAAPLAWPLALGAAPLLVRLGDVPLCAFRLTSGRPCPLCGGTRACAALVEGNLATAWQSNPGLLPVLAVAAAHTVQLAREAWTGRAAPSMAWGVPWRIAGTLLIAAWFARLITGS